MLRFNMIQRGRGQRLEVDIILPARSCRPGIGGCIQRVPKTTVVVLMPVTTFARTLYGAAIKDEAKRRALRSLEIAPAQQLLLKINGGIK